MKRLKILIEEDNPGDVFLLRESLQEQTFNHDIQVCYDGEPVIRFISEAQSRNDLPDAFIVDVQMPKVSGLAIATKIRSARQFEKVPIVLLSSLLSPADEKLVAQLPLCFYLDKPNSLDEWLKVGEFIQTVAEGLSLAHHVANSPIRLRFRHNCRRLQAGRAS